MWLEDALEIHVRLDKEGVLHISGASIEGNTEDNLVVKAYRLLQADYAMPGIDIYLHKHIPSGAGLGGGSADAAFMLRLLDTRFGLNISDDELEVYAAKLGADCAFFIRNKPTFAEGIGNLFSPIDISLKGYQILLVKLPIFVSTREAFALIKPHRPQYALRDVAMMPISQWREFMVNDFEESVFAQYPEIGELKEQLYQQGAVYAAMSGSGSSVFGLFAPDATIPSLELSEDTFVYQGRL